MSPAPAATLSTSPSTVRPTAAPEPPKSRWPRSLAALQVRDYRLYLSSQVVATSGLWMQRIAQDWLVLQLTGSVTAVGIAVALQFLPVLLFGLAGGVLVDRFPKRRILLVTQGTAAALALTLALLTLTGTIEVWQVYIVAAGLGFVTVLDNPTRQVFVSELVGPEHIQNAVSLNSSVFQLGALVGPALSGALIHAVGQGWSFLINTGACLVVVTIVAVIKPSRAAARPTKSSRLRDGLHYVRRSPSVAWSIVLAAVVGLLGLNMPVILTAFADHVFRGGITSYSVFNSLTAVGALTGAILSARRRSIPRLRTLTVALVGLGVLLALGAGARTEWQFSIVLLGIGFCTLQFLTGANALVQSTAPLALRGRVMSVYLLVLLGGQAIGGPVAGMIIDRYGARSAMLGCGVLIVLACVLAGLAMARRSHLTVAFGHLRDRGPALVHIVPAQH